MAQPTANLKPSVLVLGGGLAGLAASLALAEKGLRVRLVEKRSLLGGRAGSFQDPESGELVDNCQHVSLRCCAALQDFLSKIGAAEMVRFHSRIDFLDSNSRLYGIQASPLPAPWHLLPSLLSLRPLSFRERLSLARAGWKILRKKPEEVSREDLNFRAWLVSHGQSERAIRFFWEPLIVSALNETVEKASARSSLQVIREGLLRNRRAYEVGIPTVPLARIYSEKGMEALSRKGVQVELRKSAARIECRPREGGFSVGAVRFSDGSEISADLVVAAIPFHHLIPLLPSEIAELEFFRDLRKLKTSPIVGVHLWLDRRVIGRPFIALPGRTIQWAFEKAGTNAGEFGLSLVVSAAREIEAWPKGKILEVALRELREAFPEARDAKLLRSIVVKEKNATFSPEPGVDRLRPGTKTPVSGLFLAGDWVQTGWPATMEGAVRSGVLAAEEILVQSRL